MVGRAFDGFRQCGDVDLQNVAGHLVLEDARDEVAWPRVGFPQGIDADDTCLACNLHLRQPDVYRLANRSAGRRDQLVGPGQAEP